MVRPVFLLGACALSAALGSLLTFIVMEGGDDAGSSPEPLPTSTAGAAIAAPAASGEARPAVPAAEEATPNPVAALGERLAADAPRETGRRSINKELRTLLEQQRYGEALELVRDVYHGRLSIARTEYDTRQWALFALRAIAPSHPPAKSELIGLQRDLYASFLADGDSTSFSLALSAADFAGDEAAVAEMYRQAARANPEAARQSLPQHFNDLARGPDAYLLVDLIDDPKAFGRRVASRVQILERLKFTEKSGERSEAHALRTSRENADSLRKTADLFEMRGNAEEAEALRMAAEDVDRLIGELEEKWGSR